MLLVPECVEIQAGPRPKATPDAVVVGREGWLKRIVPEGMTVYGLSENFRRRIRIPSSIVRTMNQELKRHALKMRVFASVDILLHPLLAILTTVDDNTT